MFISRQKKNSWYFFVFIIPAILLYSLFFIFPMIQGVQYSFTDWNGITPEIPVNLSKTEFEEGVLGKLDKTNDRVELARYYAWDEAGSNYTLRQWITTTNNGKVSSRKLDNFERAKVKGILKKAGITSIHFIGMDNYVEVFTKDTRFKPRVEQNFFYQDYNDLPQAFAKDDFKNYLLPHVTNQADRNLLMTYYPLDAGGRSNMMTASVESNVTNQLKAVISKNMYKTVFNMGVIGFTLFFTIFNVIGANVLALLLALLLDTKLKTRNVLRSVFFMPNVLSLVIVAFVWSFLFQQIFPRITGIAQWLGNPDIAPIGVLMVTIWQGCGYLMIIYLAGLQGIPKEIMECAELDGANALQRFRHITIPMLLPSITICLFYSLAGSLKQFDAIYALTGGGPGYATTPIVLDIYNNAFVQNRFGYGTAKAILLCIIIIIITGLQLFFMKRKEVEL